MDCFFKLQNPIIFQGKNSFELNGFEFALTVELHAILEMLEVLTDKKLHNYYGSWREHAQQMLCRI